MQLVWAKVWDHQSERVSFSGYQVVFEEVLCLMLQAKRVCSRSLN